jgi:hypothetical protein
LLGVGLGALCVGLAVAHGLRRLEPAAPAPRAKSVATTERDAGIGARDLRAAAPNDSPREANRVADAGEGTGGLANSEARAGTKVAVSDATAASDQPSQATVPTSAPPLSAAQLAPHFQLGIVAYDRCDGLPQRPGRFPCPRDLQLEQHVWHALRALEDCALSSSLRGQGEVRFEFRGAPAASLRVRAPPKDGLDREVVTKCAGPALSSARTTLTSDHMVVRFRFELN